MQAWKLLDHRGIGWMSWLACTGSKRAWLKMNVPALTSGNTQNFLTFSPYDNRCFRHTTSTESTVRRSDDNMLTDVNEKFDLFRWSEIRNWHCAYEHPNRTTLNPYDRYHV
jgi:hypothetical protein